jgi:Xaa-Pro aminopeptidase
MAIAQPADEFRQRRQKLLDKMAGRSAAVFRSNEVYRRNGDVDYEYRQDSNFYYLTGFTEPEAALILAPPPGIYVRSESKFVKEILFVRPRDRRMETWTGKRLGVEGAKETLGFEAALPITEFDAYLGRLLARIDTLYIDAGRVGLDDPLNRDLELINRARERLYDFKVVNPQPTLAAMRVIKSPSELKLLRKAIEITSEAHRELMRRARPGMYEYELEAIVEYEFRRRGSERLGFPSIVGSGPNSTVLHYDKNNRKTEAGDVVVVDIGAEYGMYTADVTRTIPISGKFSEAQKQIYSIVLRAQQAAIDLVKPGANIREIGQVATREVVKGLIEVGLLKGSVDENLKSRAYRKYFMHGVSHYVGLDVHDVGTYGELQPGMVITVEPGIYISADVGRDNGVDPKYWNIGVRIEDDVLVTESGHEVLSAKAPRTIAEIEALMQTGEVAKASNNP